MRRTAPVRWTILSLATLLSSTAAFGALAGLTDDPSTPDHARHDDTLAHDDLHAATLDPHVIRDFDPWTPVPIRHEPWRPLEEGKIPTKEEANGFATRWSRFIAIGDEGLDKLRAEGQFRGNGTPEDPYIIERFHVTHDLVIQSTDRAIVLREGRVDGQLKLNYNGPHVHVHHVEAKDLRVNENVRRSGDNTGGLFHDNRFGYVGQIRHFTGAFFDNTVGPKPAGTFQTALGDSGAVRIPEAIVFNFDGFHGADVHHNVFHGQVDIKLHGHNHGDCFLCPIHDHADPTGFPTDQEGHEAPDANHTEHQHETGPEAEALGMRSHHSIRYHSLLFRDNTIHIARGTALRYNDINHAGDDRTANSEPNQYLEDPHVHYQDVSFLRNKLQGGPFVLELFNAHDKRHALHDIGALRLVGNEIAVHYDRGASRTLYGMLLSGADGLELLVAKNKVSFVEKPRDDAVSLVKRTMADEPEKTGIRLHIVRTGNLTFATNRVTSGDHGIFANALAPAVHWELLGNEFRTTHAYRATAVEHPPHESDDPEDTRRARAEDGGQDTTDPHHGHGGH